VLEEATSLGLVSEDGQKAKSTVAARTAKDVEIVAAAKQHRPIGAGGFQDEQAIEQTAQMRIPHCLTLPRPGWHGSTHRSVLCPIFYPDPVPTRRPGPQAQ
jgi:hypothetical protein